jgi:hypothetical protein
MDNRYHCYKCPPLMSDGRFITNYTPRRSFEQYIRNLNNINTAQEYKTFLQTNANNIMANEQKFYNDSNTCNVNGACSNVCNSKNCSTC